MVIVQLLVIALIGEAIWETLKMTWQEGKVKVDRIGMIVVGLLLAFGAQADLLAMVGIPLVIPYLGYVLTGLLISRGANFLHDIWSAIGALRNRYKPSATVVADKVKPLAPTVATPKSASAVDSLNEPLKKLVSAVKVIKIGRRTPS